MREAIPLDERMDYPLNMNDVNYIGLGTPRVLEFEKPRVPSIKEFASLPDLIGYFDKQFKYADAVNDKFDSVYINTKSSTGIWSGSGTKKNNEYNTQTLFCLAEEALRKYVESKLVPQAFFTGVIKNKPEVYKREEVETKTRNIIAFNFPATIIP